MTLLAPETKAETALAEAMALAPNELSESDAAAVLHKVLDHVDQEIGAIIKHTGFSREAVIGIYINRIAIVRQGGSA